MLLDLVDMEFLVKNIPMACFSNDVLEVEANPAEPLSPHVDKHDPDTIKKVTVQPNLNSDPIQIAVCSQYLLDFCTMEFRDKLNGKAWLGTAQDAKE